MEVFLTPEACKRRIRSLDQGPDQAPAPGIHAITFRRERRINQVSVSPAGPEAEWATPVNGIAVCAGDTVNRLMANRHRRVLGRKVEFFRGPASEMSAAMESDGRRIG